MSATRATVQTGTRSSTVPVPSSDIRHDDLQAAIRFAGQSALQRANVCLPGVVVAFDADAKRAEVQPAIDRMVLSGNASVQVPHPVILDVPVVYPKGGGYAITFPLAVGDDVLLVFSQRGMSDFKERLSMSGVAASGSRPDRGVFFRIADAIAVPGLASGDDVVLTDSLNVRVPAGGDITVNGQRAFDYVGPLIASVPILTGTALTNKADYSDITNEDITFDPNFPMSLRFGIGYIDFLGSINFPKFYAWPQGVDGLLVQVRDSDDAVVSETSFAKTATDLFNETVGGSPRQIPAAIRWRWNEMFVSSVPSGSDTAWTAHATRGGHGTFFVGRRLRPTRGSFLYRTMKPPNMAAPAGLTLQYRFKVAGGSGLVL